MESLLIAPNELIVDNFAGGGGASLGIGMALGRSPDIAINHDREAIAMHAANHPDTKHYCEDVWHVDPVEACNGRPVGLAWFSPDCFPAGTLVLTREGYRPIEQIREGDEVLTHRGRWKQVTETSSTVRPLIRLRGHGHPGLLVSPEHPFFARKRRDIWNNGLRRYERRLEPAAWTPASMLDRGWYWATPTEYPQTYMPAIPAYRQREMAIDTRLLWLAGRYVADGWTRLTDVRAELVITCGHHEISALRELLAFWPRKGTRSGTDELTWHERATRTAYQFTTTHRGLVQWLREHFGHGAAEKSIPGWAFGMLSLMRQALLEGYLSGDGCRSFADGGNELVMLTTVSKALALGVKALSSSLGFSPTVYFNANPNDVIEGRKVNALPAWVVRWRNPVASGREQTEREDGLEWSPIREQEDTGQVAEVFNIGVEEDESYIVEGIVVHNCKHFSKAKGGKPVSKQIRGLAWVIIRWAKAVKPRVIILENVEEFKTWGPVLPDGQPCPESKGQTFRRWKTQLENLGYQIDHRELRASDYGTPTIRKRLFLVARCDGLAIRWPEATHGDPKKIARDLFTVHLKPWRTAAECIDWSLPCPSIFERDRPLAENTLRRIAAGIRRFVVEAKEPFIVNMAHGGKLEDVNRPISTIATEKGGCRALVTPFFAGVGGRAGQTPERSPEQPYRKITAKADGAVICPTLIQTGYGEREGQAPRVPGLDKPLGTVVAGAAKHALVTPLLVGTGGPAYSAKPRPAAQPMHTMTTESRAALVSAFLAKHYTGVVGSDLVDPIGTVTATDHHSLVTAHIQRDFGASVGHPAGEPLGTVTGGGGGKSSLVSSHLLKLKGTCKDGQAVDEPLATVQAGGLHYGEVRAFLLKYFGTDQDPRLEEPLHTVTSKDRFGLVTVRGEEYVIVDIGLRMLTPPELYRAQGFPEDYLIAPEMGGKRLSKTAQVRMCGNSVCPPIAAEVARAQFEGWEGKAAA